MTKDSTIKGSLFPLLTQGANSEENNCHGFVEVYLNKSSGEIVLGSPYMDENNHPARVEKDVQNFQYLGTANISFKMPFRRQPKAKVGDIVQIWDVIARVIKVNIKLAYYIIEITEEDNIGNEENNFLGYGLHNISFNNNGWITVLKSKEENNIKK